MQSLMAGKSSSKHYESFIMLLAALLNGVAGIVVDLYAPCLPNIAKELQVTAVTMQNTISASIVGYALGQIVFGILCDWKGRKSSIILGLVLFTLASFLATIAHSIELLMLARILQGFAAGSCQVIARAIIIDVIKGPRFTIAVIYLSTAFGLGLIIGPYFGAQIEQYLSWRWNFVAYAFYSLALLIMVIYGLRESLPYEHIKIPWKTLTSYRQILFNKVFIFSFVQLACCFIAFTLWNQVGPFIVEHQLGKSATYFGLIALLAGVAYLVGTLLNRLLINHTTLLKRVKLSSCLFLLGIVLMMINGYTFNLIFLLPGLMLINLAQGIAFPNVLSQAMAIFPDKAGVSASLQGAGMLILGSLGLGLVSLISISSSLTLSFIYLILLLSFLIARGSITKLR